MSENVDKNTDLPVMNDLSREEIILTKHYFEHGDLEAALTAAGYKKEAAVIVKRLVNTPSSKICQFYRQLCRDRVESTIISTEKKRIKLWKLTEWSVEQNENGKLNDARLAIQCLDMLNRMDGDYSPVMINTKSQIQKQSVNFSQKIPSPESAVTSKSQMDDILVEHKQIVES